MVRKKKDEKEFTWLHILLLFLVIILTFGLGSYFYDYFPSIDGVSLPYRGEPCEEVSFIEFVYDTTNQTDKERAIKAWDDYTYENKLKGYCNNGKRIGSTLSP